MFWISWMGRRNGCNSWLSHQGMCHLHIFLLHTDASKFPHSMAKACSQLQALPHSIITTSAMM